MYNIASRCIEGIRVWHFDYVFIHVSGDYLALFVDHYQDCLIEGKENFADVLDIALRNSYIKCLRIVSSPDDILPLPNKSALEIEELILNLNGVSPLEFFVDLIARCRKVQPYKLV
ncbi:hypothetical protein AAVH_17935 [Aphelenchoides avenae]|nr:hypothetical protein AAVH_17935 [Aphelenchus avenae]